MDRTTLLDQLLSEERRLRSLAEAEVRAYRKTLTKLALRLAPAAFDARRRQDPTSFERFSPDDWQSFFESVQREEERPKKGWGSGQQATGNEQRTEEHGHQQATSSERIADSQPPTANSPQLSAISLRQAMSNEQRTDSEQQAANSQRPVAVRQQPAASSQPPKADRSSLPPSPPSRYAALFANWEREGLALQILATTGWSLRYAVDEALATAVGIGSGSGSLKRLFARLEKLGLVTSQVYDLGGVRAAILLLSERGSQVAQGCGFTLVPSEWDILLAAHGGERQTKHAALCCAFAYQARKRGWTVELCPDVEGNAQPDMTLLRGEERIFVEVEAESGEAERRMRKWRNQSDLQGYVALCANNGGVRERLVLEARAASKHGVATDLTALIKGQDDGESMWVERWGRKAAIGG
jgi:hypothetical protein